MAKKAIIVEYGQFFVGQTISGAILKHLLLDIGSAHGGFNDDLLEDVAERNFELQLKDVSWFLMNDPIANETIQKLAQNYKRRNYEEDGGLCDTDENRNERPVRELYDEPMLVIDNEIRDGYSRLADHRHRGDNLILAWVATDN